MQSGITQIPQTEEHQYQNQITLSGVRFHVIPPEQSNLSSYLERRELLDLVLPSLEDSLGPPLRVLLVGPPGSGKSSLAAQAACKLGLPLWRFVATDSVAAEDWNCQARIANGVVEYVLGPLAAAAFHGGLCLLDDIDKAGVKALSGLVQVMDEGSNSLFSVLGAVAIPIHPSFRLMLAANDLHSLPAFLRTRCVVFHIDHPSVEQTLHMVKSRLPGIDELERAFLRSWEKRCSDSEHTISPREATLVFRLGQKLTSSGQSAAMAMEAALDSVLSHNGQGR